MANRFDVGTPQKYVSIYPFQELAAIGEKLNARAAQTQQKMSAIEDAISKVDVADQVLVEGSSIGDTYNPGIQWASTGYTQFKNNLLNTVKTGHDDLVRLWQSGEISISDLERESNALNNSILKDYNKLLAASESSKIIDEANKEYRKNANASNAPEILNELARAGSQFIKNPYSFTYTGAPIANLINEQDAVNKYASGFKDSDIGQLRALSKDANGYILYGKASGTTAERVKAVLQGLDTDPEIGSQLKRKAYRDVANQMDPDTKEFQPLVEKRYEAYKNNFMQQVLAKAVNIKQENKLVFDKIGYDKQKEKEKLDRIKIAGDVIPTGDVITVISNKFPELGKYITEEEGGKLRLKTPSKLDQMKIWKEYVHDWVYSNPKLNAAQKLIAENSMLTDTKQYDLYMNDYLKREQVIIDNEVKKLAKEAGLSDKWAFQGLNDNAHSAWDNVLKQASEKLYEESKYLSGARRYNTVLGNGIKEDILKYGTQGYSFYDNSGNLITEQEDLNNILLNTTGQNKTLPNKNLVAISNDKVPKSGLSAIQIKYTNKDGEEKIAYAHPKGEVHRTSIEQANTVKNDASQLFSLIRKGDTPEQQNYALNTYLNKNNNTSNLIDNVSANANMPKKLIVDQMLQDNPGANKSEVNNNIKILREYSIGNSYVALTAYRPDNKSDFKFGLWQIKNGIPEFFGDPVNADQIQSKEFIESSEGQNILYNVMSGPKGAEKTIKNQEEQEEEQ